MSKGLSANGIVRWRADFAASVPASGVSRRVPQTRVDPGVPWKGIWTSEHRTGLGTRAGFGVLRMSEGWRLVAIARTDDGDVLLDDAPISGSASAHQLQRVWSRPAQERSLGDLASELEVILLATQSRAPAADSQRKK